MFAITINQIINAVSGQPKNIKNKNLVVSFVKTNHKEIEPNSIFVALVGKNFDGHDFAKKAIENKALLVVTEKELKNLPQIIVKNTKEALLNIAKLNKSMFLEKLVGITGSVGKTTTKDMLAEILSSCFKTLKTQQNLNNEIGLSQTILKLNKSYKAAVVEMGMSNLGEIKALSKACTPDIGIITNIGISHIEFLKTKENILKAKLEILKGMKKNSHLILNADDCYLKNLNFKDYNIIFCGIKNENCTYSAKKIKQTEMTTQFQLFKKNEFITKITLPTIGEHNVLNSLFAIAAAELFKVPIEKIKNALKGFCPSDMRQKIYNFNGIIAIADFYNSTPESSKAAIKTLKQLAKNSRKIAVLGSMLELGDFSKKAHLEIGEFVAKNQIEILFCYGVNAKEIEIGAKMVNKNLNKKILIKHFNDKNKLINCLKKTLTKKDVVLLKASRKMKFEDVFDAVFNTKKQLKWKDRFFWKQMLV